MRRIIAILALLVSALPPARALDLSAVLETMPEGGWARVSGANTWPSQWPSPRAAGDPAAIVYAWSSFAWDSQRSQLMLWGGGHANYAGNEMYLWSGTSGLWSRGTLPSAYQSGTSLIVGNGAPQSSHTYDNSLYLPISDRYVTFGGAAWNSGGNFDSAAGREGPWLWNPALANPNRVGGQDGTGLVGGSLGSNSWQSRRGSITGTLPPSFVEAATGYRSEGGKDVVYIAGDTGASGFPSLYRYEFNLGGNDVVQKVGVMSSSTNAYEGTATVDTQRGWFVRTAWGGGVSNDLAVWDLTRNNAATPEANASFSVRLRRADGSDYNIVQPGTGSGHSTGIEFDQQSGLYYLWNGSTIVRLTPGVNLDGTPTSEWLAEPIPYTTPTWPTSLGQGILGKWQYLPELGAFAALSTVEAGGDTGVWLYKPLAAVPEPATVVQLAAGLAVLAGVARRRRIKES